MSLPEKVPAELVAVLLRANLHSICYQIRDVLNYCREHPEGLLGKDPSPISEAETLLRAFMSTLPIGWYVDGFELLTEKKKK